MPIAPICTVGVFLYIGASDLLPRAHEHASRLGVALSCIGFALIFLVVEAAA